MLKKLIGKMEISRCFFVVLTIPLFFMSSNMSLLFAGRIFGLPYSLETHCEMVLTPTSMRSVIIILCTSVTLESFNIILTQTFTRGRVTYTAVVIQCVVQHTVACYKERDENELTDEYGWWSVSEMLRLMVYSQCNVFFY